MTQDCEIVTICYTSAALRDNPLGDPATREILVITPPGYTQSKRTYPVIFWLAGFGARGKDLLHANVLGDSLPGRLSRAMRFGVVPEAIVVLPDCSTRFGGSQYLDSPGCGRYQTYLADEVVPVVDEQFRSCRPTRRAIGGKSSGGYGALLMAMQRPGVFDAVCAHSADAGFEWCYLSLLPAVLDTIQARGGWAALTADPRAAEPKDEAYMVAMSLIAMAASYAAEPNVDLAEAFPCDLRTGRFRDATWQRWLEHDPVRLATAHASQLRALRALYLDVGRADDYAMHWGARALHEALGEAAVPHEYEEHDGGHHGIEHRFMRSLALVGRHWASTCAA